MKAICLVLLLLALVSADFFTYDGDVIVLTEKDFDQAIEEFEYTMVAFYAPWCKYSKALLPEYAYAATQLANFYPDVKLCKVNADYEVVLAERFQIVGYPTIKFFRKGGSQYEEYDGDRTSSDIIQYIMQQVSYP